MDDWFQFRTDYVLWARIWFMAAMMWQADPSLLGRLAEAIDGGCAQGDAGVLCSNSADAPAAMFVKVDDRWLLKRFIAAP